MTILIEQKIQWARTYRTLAHRNHNIKRNTTSDRVQKSGLNYGSHNLDSLVKTQCPKTNKYSHNASNRIHRNKLS